LCFQPFFSLVQHWLCLCWQQVWICSFPTQEIII
jgi:hypothetical protein